MRVAWLARATANLLRHADYIARDNPQAAEKMMQAVHRSVLRLVDFPHSGRPGRSPGTRELVVPGTPFILPYRVEPDRVVILRVMHGRQRWPHLV